MKIFKMTIFKSSIDIFELIGMIFEILRSLGMPWGTLGKLGDCLGELQNEDL